MFRTFFAKLMALQKQVDTPYHTDGFLCDRLLTAVGLPAIHSSLRDRMPRSSQEAVNLIANQLSDKVKSAGSASACVAHFDDEDSNAAYVQVLYSLGKAIGEDARRNIKTPWVTSSKFRGGSNSSN